MIIDTIKDAILSNIGPLRTAPRNWHKRNCMLCNTTGHGIDKRSRFGIQFNHDNIIMHCFNCGFKAVYTEGQHLSSSFKTFLRSISIQEDFIKVLEFELFKQKNNIIILKDGDEKNTDKESKLKTLFDFWKPVDLPIDSQPITTWLEMGLDDADFMQVVHYAINRKIFNLDKFYWSPIKQNNLNHRLIIPYYYKHKIVGFTSRISYDVDLKGVPKYFQHLPTNFVYNLDNQYNPDRKYVIVNEGVLDAWNTGGVATLGAINQTKIDIINRLQRSVIVSPDRDLKGFGLVQAAIDNNWSVSFPNWESGIKDASAASAKYGKLLTLQSIITSAVSGKDKIKIRWKIEQTAREKHISYGR